MLLRKNAFFLLLIGIVLLPFMLHKLLWIARSEKTNAILNFRGKSYTGQLMHDYTVIGFLAGKDTFWFNGNDNILYKEGETIPVRYQKNNPHDARLNIFPSMWGDTLIYGGIPVLVLLMLFLHPHIFPRKTLFRLSGKKPFVQVIQAEHPLPALA